MTQYSLLDRRGFVGEVRQCDLGGMLSLDETTLTRSLRRLMDAGWLGVNRGEDGREKVVRLTKSGPAKLPPPRQAWGRAQRRICSRCDGAK
jgi:DNA-binding MarR family transcriptional regulator